MMYAESQSWQTPLLPKDFDWKAQGEQLDQTTIAPAVERIIANMVSSRLSEVNPLNRNALVFSQPRSGWDSVVRFTERMERVMPFQLTSSDAGIGAEPNPGFEQAGLIVFSRSSSTGAYSVKEERRILNSDLGQRLLVWITVKIPDESIFETEWFRLS